MTNDSPIGDRQSSPKVWNEYAATSHHGLTITPRSVWRAASTMNTYPIATSTRATAILIGVLGSRPRRASDVHSAAKKGAAITSTTGLTDWNHPAGTTNPCMTRSVRSWAKKFSEVDACSNAIQKMIVKPNSTSSATSRSRSSRVSGALTGATAAASSRFGTSPIPARYLRRSDRYRMSPAIIPTPAQPKPQCQPHSGRSAK